ncbi:hypothetical protein LCGC14_0586190 [marine sediment metagenome]|uniref:SprT-like domain-containing protein n=1 Tax=marine sediment metagenome TaxID=412755 RepID=A0A0F9UN32_9ZZZZ
MNPTKQTWALQKLKHYHDVMNIPMPKQVFFSEKEYAEYCRGQNDPEYADEVEAGAYLGSNWQKGRAIFINMDRPHYMDMLEHTIVHETVHTKHKHLKHGGRFDRYVKAYIRGKEPNYSKMLGVWDWLVGN